VRKALFWMGVGAGVMYLFDPAEGEQRRRALSRWWRNVSEPGFESQRRPRPAVQSWRLVERVGEAMINRVRHPSLIAVTASDGVVTLTGPILRHEEDRLLTAVFNVPGVTEIINQLQSFDSEDQMPQVHQMQIPVRVQ
jgi:hypothetical protein